MRNLRPLAVLACAGLLAVGVPSIAQTGDTCKDVKQLPLPKNANIAVEQICVDGTPRQSTSNVRLIPATGPTVTNGTLTVDAALPERTRIRAPGSTEIDAVSKVGNRFSSLDGIEVAVSNEIYRLEGTGVARFIVNNARGFLVNVRDRITAAVSGTAFSVRLLPDDTAVFTVTEGSVNLTQLVTAHLTQENQDVSNVHVTTTISATASGTAVSTATLPINAPVRTFANASEARSSFTQQLNAAQTAGNPIAIADAQANLQQIARVGGGGGATGSGGGGPGGAAFSAASAAAAAAVAAGAAVQSSIKQSSPLPSMQTTSQPITQPSTTPAVTPTPIVIPTATPTPIVIPTATPTATPTPTPTPLPTGSITIRSTPRAGVVPVPTAAAVLTPSAQTRPVTPALPGTSRKP